MATILDYVKNTSAPFTNEPLNRVDSLVFSWLSYLRIPEHVPEACTTVGISLKDLAATDVDQLVKGVHDPADSKALLAACAASPRFSDVIASRAIDDWSADRETQFSAITFTLPEGGAYVAFRGTDDTLVGWKENFNMGYAAAVPAQVSACAYFEEVAKALTCDLWLGGHSKGGNLAVFAYMNADDVARIWVKRCFSHDGPGFRSAATSAPTWKSDDSLVDRTIPQESIIGLLLGGAAESATIVKSTNPGILQHDPFSWVVEGTDFAQTQAQSYEAYVVNKRLSTWVSDMSHADRERFIDVLYSLVQSSGEVTMSGLIASVANGSLESMLAQLGALPQSERDFFAEQIEGLATELLIGPAPETPKTPEEKANAAVDVVEDRTARFNDRMAKLESFL